MPRVMDPALLAQLETTQNQINNTAPKPALSLQDMAAAREDALAKIRLARSLQERSRNKWFGTGFGAGLASNIAGTPAYDIQADAQTLLSGGALRKIMEMAEQNGGKNPLTPMSNSDVNLIANSIANLDVGQSDEQFQRNAGQYERAYLNAFRAAGGAKLPPDLMPRQNGAPAVGTVENGYRFKGGNPANPASWVKVPTR